MALSLAKQGIETLLLDENNQVSEGSRAICFAKRSLEIFDKLGVAKPMIEKGVQWNVGRIFFKEDEIDCFDLSPEKVSKYPAFINLQQYYVEQYLIDAVLKEKNADVRWLNKVVNVATLESKVATLHIETPEGNYSLKTKYLIACDGSKSTIRNLLGLELHGERFEERFLIADFKMEADFPSERWFWFDPPFARGQSILLHKQPDNLWRLDFKLGRNAQDYEDPGPDGATGDVVQPDEYGDDVEVAAADIINPKRKKELKTFKSEPSDDLGVGRKKRK